MTFMVVRLQGTKVKLYESVQTKCSVYTDLRRDNFHIAITVVSFPFQSS